MPLTRFPERVIQETPVSCFRACVASLLGLSWAEVPRACDGDVWDWDAFQLWLDAEHDLQAIEVVLEDSPRLYPVKREVPCIITGQSPRECTTGRHAVVAAFSGMEGFRILHDPHPSESGIVGDPTMITFLVPIAGWLKS